MALSPAITDIEQLKGHPALDRLLAWKTSAVAGAKFDRGEMTITVDRSAIREACALLRDDPQPSRDKIVGRMQQNLCRCGAHRRIVDAIEQASEKPGSGR